MTGQSKNKASVNLHYFNEPLAGESGSQVRRGFVNPTRADGPTLIGKEGEGKLHDRHGWQANWLARLAAGPTRSWPDSHGLPQSRVFTKSSHPIDLFSPRPCLGLMIA
jgi:hypothetical protein